MNAESSRGFESNKTLGAVGALLVAIGSFIPFSGPVGILAIVGIVLVLISMKGLAENFGNDAIFRNAFYGFIFGVIALIAGITVFATIFFGFFMGGFMMRPFAFGVGWGPAIVALVVVFVFFILEAYFYKQAFDALANKARERLFATGALLLLIGAALTIIFVGFIIHFVAWILIAVAFFSMRPPTETTQAAATQPAQPETPTIGQVKYCSYCGASNRLDATFCTRCGRKLAEVQSKPPAE
ncbi:MAG: DUF996 domain-containing protein [Candidatus Bathyarchaeia archaeon]